MKTVKSQRILWYTRRNGVVRGPYPQQQISRYILLGRICPDGEVRPEGGAWQSLSVYPELIPEVMRLPPTEENLEKLLIARMREDERQPVDRRERAPNGCSEEVKNLRSGRERRRAETEEQVRHRLIKYQVAHQPRASGKLYRYPLVAVALVLLGFMLSYLLELGAPETVPPDCAAPARPGVNWNHCNQIGLVAEGADLVGAQIGNARLDAAQLSGASMAGVNLEYSSLNLSNLSRADLSHARLVGVALRGSDLRNSKLVDADLSYANLSGARIEGADLSGAILDNAIWIDQQACMPGSVGGCRIQVRK